MSFVLSFLFACVAGTPPVRAPHELLDYLRKPDSSYSYRVVKENELKTELQMTSQTWHGVAWKHTILFQKPSELKYPHTAILYITGDGPKNGDLLDLALVTQATGMPVAMLFDIPNQPIDGRREDDLIAHTFEEYIKHPDPSLPLLFPMAKSAIRTMDAIQDLARKSKNPIDRFVVAGASKRGWTTWMVGAAHDSRVKAIVPMVFDTLNLPRQMKHQIESWGAYSEQIQDYTRRGLQEQLGTPKGHDLGVIIDPYSYRADIKAPTLIIKGSNDPYWTADALDLYWHDLAQPKWLLTVPNAGHTLGNGLMAVAAIGAFARSVAGEFQMPSLSWNYRQSGRTIQLEVRSTHHPMVRVRLWAAASDTLDFRKSTYEAVVESAVDSAAVKLESESPHGSGRATLGYELPPGKNVALFGEIQYSIHGRQFSLSTPTKVIPATSR